MSKMKNKVFHDIALQAGGSHYPGVGGELLEKFAELLVKHCAEQCKPESGLKYSPNSLSSRKDCEERILGLLE